MSINFEIICRLCMKYSNSMISLFHSNCTLPHKIMMLIPALKICAGDNLPTQVCQECADQINSFDSFKLLCESSNLTLIEYLQTQESVKLKGEKCEDWEISSDVGTSDISFSQDHTDKRKSIKNFHENVEEDENSCPEIKEEHNAEEYKYDVTKAEPEIEIAIADKSYITDDIQLNESVSDSSKITKSSESFSTPCHICGKMVVRRRLTDHVKRHTVGRPYKCEDCGKMYIDKSSLILHSVVHSGLKIHMCDICGKRFKLLTHLKNHYLTHTGQKSFICDVCGKKFSQIGNLKKHEIIHTGQKPFSCDICGKCFTIKNLLQIHLATHAGQKEHFCDICGKGFLMKGHLTNHLIVHSGEKRFSCDVCGNRYAQRNNLSRHKAKHHIQK